MCSCELNVWISCSFHHLSNFFNIIWLKFCLSTQCKLSTGFCLWFSWKEVAKYLELVLSYQDWFICEPTLSLAWSVNHLPLCLSANQGLDWSIQERVRDFSCWCWLIWRNKVLFPPVQLSHQTGVGVNENSITETCWAKQTGKCRWMFHTLHWAGCHQLFFLWDSLLFRELFVAWTSKLCLVHVNHWSRKNSSGLTDNYLFMTMIELVQKWHFALSEAVTIIWN